VSERFAVRTAVEALRAAGEGSAWLDATRAMGTAIGADAAGIVIWDGKSHEVLSIDGYGFTDSLASEYQQEFRKYDRMLEEPPPPAISRPATNVFQMCGGHATLILETISTGTASVKSAHSPCARTQMCWRR
jgi:hypothetical protein